MYVCVRARAVIGTDSPFIPTWQVLFVRLPCTLRRSQGMHTPTTLITNFIKSKSPKDEFISKQFSLLTQSQQGVFLLFLKIFLPAVLLLAPSQRSLMASFIHPADIHTAGNFCSYRRGGWICRWYLI